MEFTCEKCGWLMYANGLCICGYSGRPTTRNDSCMAWKTSIITNADRVRAMTDEELAKWIESLEPNKCPSDDWFDRCETWTCKGCFLNWLKKEANDDE